MVHKFFDKYSSGSIINNVPNKELAEELHTPIISQINKRKVKSPFIDNIWEADLEDMQLISKFNNGSWFLLYVIDIYSRYAWALEDKRGITFKR